MKSWKGMISYKKKWKLILWYIQSHLKVSVLIGSTFCRIISEQISSGRHFQSSSPSNGNQWLSAKGDRPLIHLHLRHEARNSCKTGIYSLGSKLQHVQHQLINTKYEDESLLWVLLISNF